jgi:hypothetical protein
MRGVEMNLVLGIMIVMVIAYVLIVWEDKLNG